MTDPFAPAKKNRAGWRGNEELREEKSGRRVVRPESDGIEPLLHGPPPTTKTVDPVLWLAGRLAAVDPTAAAGRSTLILLVADPKNARRVPAREP